MIKKVKIHDLVVEYEVVHRDVKYARLEIKTDKLRLIMPLNYYDDKKIIKKHENWVYTKISRINASKIEANHKKINFRRSDQEFKTMVLYLVDTMSNEIGVNFNKVRFKRMKTRWGSCSSKNNLNFNLYLKYLPDHLVEYVVFHEIAHLLEMNHNKRFWKLISYKYPEYKKMEDELLIYWIRVRELMDNHDMD